MHTEIEYAVNFIVDTIKEKSSFTEDVCEKLKGRLTELLKQRYENHWYEDKPMKGSAYRCINISAEDGTFDQVLTQAAEESGISLKQLLNIFNKGMALWVDPNDVSCRLGKGSIFFIYKKLKDNNNINTKAGLPSASSITFPQRRPQQRPRSTSPPTMTSYAENYIQTTRPRSTTPPGFSSMDAGKLYQSYTRPAISVENLQKLWDTIPNTTSPSYMQMPSSSVTSYSQGYNTQLSTSSYSNKGTADSSYSFNQYSSYYSPSTNTWKKNSRYQGKQNYNRSYWQDDDIYQRYHWSRNDLKTQMSVAGNDISLKSYSYATSRQAQEVC